MRSMADEAKALIENKLPARSSRVVRDVVSLLAEHGIDSSIDWQILRFPDKSSLTIGSDGVLTAHPPTKIRINR